MKLDIDCVREVLLYLENIETYVTDDDGDITLKGSFLGEICEAIPKYPKEQIFYTLSTLEDGGFLNMTTQWASNSVHFCHVSSLTYEGHELLESVRDENHWSAIKSGLSAVRNYSLSAVAAIAEGVTSAAISAYLGGLKTLP